MAVRKLQEEYTIEDILNLPDGQRAELIDGQIYMMAPPNRIHQDIIEDLNFKIKEYIKSNNGNCKVYSAPFGVYLFGDDSNYVEPDISVICDENKLNDKGCNGSPDWIIEIVSPSSIKMDYHTKVFKYRTAGVSEYWIIDYYKNRITVWNFKNSETIEYNFTDEIPVGIYKDLKIRIEQS